MTTTPTSVEVGGKLVTIERVSARKASRALALMRALSKEMPDLQSDLAKFRRQYEADNVLALDRVQARLRNPARPMTDERGELILTPPVYSDDGDLVDPGGQPVMLPSPVDRLTEADWEQTGHKYLVPSSPSNAEVVTAIFDKAVEVAEDHVYQLLALFTMSNEDVVRYRKNGELPQRLAELADELLDSADDAGDLLELAVVIGETVDDQFRSKSAELGGRMGKALRALGIDWSPKPTPAPEPSTDGPSSSSAISSTDSPASTPDGPPTSSSAPASTSSSSSATSPSSTEPAKTSLEPAAVST
jgi:hypothetical protein